MGYPCTPQSIARACHALPLYAVQAATPEKYFQLFKGGLLVGRAACDRFTITLETPCYAGLKGSGAR
jgi:hypothetical protein